VIVEASAVLVAVALVVVALAEVGKLKNMI